MEEAESKKMISSFVFLDLEATGLQLDQPKITELSLVAVQRNGIMNTSKTIPPRVIDKLTLCFYPMKSVSPSSAVVTGLYNDELLHHKDFDEDAAQMLSLFMNRLDPPVALVAHNGNNYDFPLLMTELQRVQGALPPEVLCCDSLAAVRCLDGLPMYPLGKEPFFSPKQNKDAEKAEVATEEKQNDISCNDSGTVVTSDIEGEDTNTYSNKGLPPSTPELTTKKPELKQLTSTPKSILNDSLPKVDVSPLSEMLGKREADGQNDSGIADESISDKSHSADEAAAGDPPAVKRRLVLCDAHQLSPRANNQDPNQDPNQVVQFPPIGPKVCAFQATSENVNLSPCKWLDTADKLLTLQGSAQETPLWEKEAWVPDVESAAVRKVKRKLFNSPPAGTDNIPKVITSEKENDILATPLIPDKIRRMVSSKSSPASNAKPSVAISKANGKSTAEEIVWADYEEEDSISDEDMKKLMCDSTFVSPCGSIPSTPHNQANKSQHIIATPLRMQAVQRSLAAAFQSPQPPASTIFSSGGKSLTGTFTRASANNQSVTRGTPSSSVPKCSPVPYQRKSYRLTDVHKRVCGFTPHAAHSAEDDAMAMLRICHQMSHQILPWFDEHAELFRDVPPLYTPKSTKTLPRGVFPYQ